MKQLTILLLFVLGHQFCHAQWRNLYPKVDGYGHHVYLEGYELPIMDFGPTDPAPSPDGQQVVFAAKGWLWIMNLDSKQAKRITASGGIDARPNWSPDGKQIVFVRDEGDDTRIVLLTLATGMEEVIVDTDALDLDPIFSPDGKTLYYSSAVNGSFDLWKMEMSKRKPVLIKELKGLERLPNPTSDGKIVHIKKSGFSFDRIARYDEGTGITEVLAEENFISQLSFSLSSDMQHLVYTWPNGDDYELRLLDINSKTGSILLTRSQGLPIMPKFSGDGQWVYFSEYNTNEQAELKRIPAGGGDVQTLNVLNWDHGTEMTTLRLRHEIEGAQVAVRLSITDQNGHPIVPANTRIHAEGQHGMVFFYSTGDLEISGPTGEWTIHSSRGFTSQSSVQTIKLGAGRATATIHLTKLWDPGANGWYSGDNHFHLNYGGTNRLDPEDILLDMNAEEIDVAYPLVANLGNRFLEEDLWGWENDSAGIIRIGQEVRSHFLGHLGLMGSDEIYWPWIWGPGYDVHSTDDRLNASAFRFGREHGGLGSYVHPVSVGNPFAAEHLNKVPLELVPDAVLGEVDLLELGCLWTDERGTAALWHELLNLGVPIGISAGSDVMNDLYRTMAIGSSRVYVRPDGELTADSYLSALKAGRSFVTTGPLIDFRIDSIQAGGVLETGVLTRWNLAIYSPVDFQRIELFVNGKVIFARTVDGKAGSMTLSGNIQLPESGWVTMRVSGQPSGWPVLDSYPFAETAPIWVGEVGSVDTEAQKEAAAKLLLLLEAGEKKLHEGYGDADIPNLQEQFDKARAVLKAKMN